MLESPYRAFISQLRAICKEQEIQLNFKRLKNGYRFHYIKLNDKPKKKTVCFSAGIHGDEIAGPWAILKFLKEPINTDVRLLIFPLANPYGFDNNSRYNDKRQDINRRFCDEVLEDEAKVIYDLLRKGKLDLFHSLHEWEGRSGFYLYASDRNKATIYEKLANLARPYFNVFDYTKINHERAYNGVVWHPETPYTDTRSRSALENKMYLDGIHYLATETPSKANLEERVNLTVDIMKYVINEVI